MRKIKIKDTSFRHCSYSNNPMPPVSFCEHFEWDWDVQYVGKDELIFYTHSTIDEGLSDTNGKKVCWLIEPYDLVPTNYEQIKTCNKNFEYVFTHEKTLLDLGENYKFIPFGGCWIEKGDQKIHEKSKMTSIISSWKRQLEGHRLRHQVITNNRDKMDVFGNGYTEIPKKIMGLRDYRFSVVIENCKRDYWFTEKLIDTLMTGTVPIYWGCPSIGDFFNTKGFIICNTLEDLTEAINSVTSELYNEMLPYIKENFEISKGFILGENTIHEKYLSENLL